MILQSIYQCWLERTCLNFTDAKLRLRFESEAGLQELVRGVRLPWEKSHGIKLEVSFNAINNKCSYLKFFDTFHQFKLKYFFLQFTGGD